MFSQSDGSAKKKNKAGHELQNLIKRGRGRPKKISTAFMNNLEESSDRESDTEKSGKGVKSTVRQVAGKTKRGFEKHIKKSGVGKQIASTLIDVGADVLLPASTSALSMALGDPTGLSGAVVGKVAGDQIQKQADKGGYGYGLKGKHLKAQKDKMENLFVSMGSQKKHAKSLTNKVFKEGDHILDQHEVPIAGGKITLKGVKKTLIKEAKKIWKEAKPVLKFAGESAIAYGEPFIEQGLKAVAMSYGADPATADLSSRVFTGAVHEKTTSSLNKVSKKKSKDPREVLDKVGKIIEDKSKKYIDEAEKVRLRQLEHTTLPAEEKQREIDYIKAQAQHAKSQVDKNVEKVEASIGNELTRRIGKGIHRGHYYPTHQDFTGGMGLHTRSDMSTLLSPDSVAKQTFIQLPNDYQGQIFGRSVPMGWGLNAFGGGLSAGAGLSAGFGTLYYDTMLGGSFRDLSGRGCECYGAGCGLDSFRM